MQTSARWIAVAVSGRLVGNDIPVTGPVVTDSHEVRTEPLCAAHRGESADGHASVPDAATRDAIAVIIEHEVNEAVTQIVVKDSIKALGSLARTHVEKLRSGGDLDVITVAGFMDKTATKDLLLQITDEGGSTIAPKLSFNNGVGLSLTVLLADETTRHLILEVGASGPGHITYPTDIVVPDVVIELCVGHAHAGGFGGFEGVAATKAELTKGIRPGGLVILNTDDPSVEAMAPLTTKRVTRFSTSSNERVDVTMRGVCLGCINRASFILVTPKRETPVEPKAISRRRTANALVVAAGTLTPEVGLRIVVSVPSRARVLSSRCMDVHKLCVDEMDLTLINDSYNVSLNSIRAGIAALVSTGRGSRRIAVLGEILELDKNS